MITQLIHDKLTALTSDTSSVALLFFLAFLAAYFFIFVHPAVASNRRVNRIVKRKREAYRANQIFQKTLQKNDVTRGITRGSKTVHPLSFAQKTAKPKAQRNNNNYYNNDKGYQAYLKRNSKHHDNKKIVEHSRYKRISASLKKPATKTLRPNQGKFGVKFIGNLPLNRLPQNPENIGPTNSFNSGPSKTTIY